MSIHPLGLDPYFPMTQLIKENEESDSEEEAPLVRCDACIDLPENDENNPDCS